MHALLGNKAVRVFLIVAIFFGVFYGAKIGYEEYLFTKYYVDNISEETQRELLRLGATGDATIEVLGGGGGGGTITGNGGGGGGGGEYHRCGETLSVQSYTVTVGAGSAADNAGETDSVFSGTGISITADGGGGTINNAAGTAGTGGTVTNCDTGPTTYAGGTPGHGNTTNDPSGGGGGGAGYGGKGGNGIYGVGGTSGASGGGGGGAGESGAGGDDNFLGGGTAGAGGGGVGGAGVNRPALGAGGNAGNGTPATYHIVGGGGGGGGTDGNVGGNCGTPGGGGGGGETGGKAGCRGEVRIIYIDTEVDATGGTETTSGIYRIHTFTTSGTFQVTALNTPSAVIYQSEFFMQ